MARLGILTAAALLLGTAAAKAALVVTGSVGGAPTGVAYETFDTLTPGSTGPVTLPSGIVISFDPDAAPVQGSASGIYAAPFLSGGNGTGFGNPGTGPDTTVYITTGSTGTNPSASVVLVFPDFQQYIGLLWGSVDTYNTLSFYNGPTFLGAITGVNVTSSPNGDQGVNGTLYVNINSSVPFDRVVATSSAYAFEFDNVAFSPHQVPEPTAMALLGTALVGLGLARRGRRRTA